MRGAVVGLVVIVAAVTSLVAGGGRRGAVGRPAAAPSPAQVTGPTGPTGPRQATEPWPSPTAQRPAVLAAALARAQRVIDDPRSSEAELQAAGRFQQLATVELTRASRRSRQAVLARLTGPAAASLRSDLTAADALGRLNLPRRSLPPWKIEPVPAPQTLLGYFRAAQARFRVPWQDLAAIELIETDFGHVVGLSTAGAEGPMQFMPATWAEYGTGSIHSQRDAVLAAARYLAANGAPGDMPDAIFHYNPSADYVTAVRAYASRMTADPRAFEGYYSWEVLFPLRGRLVVLPVGFPRARPVALSAATG